MKSPPPAIGFTGVVLFGGAGGLLFTEGVGRNPVAFCWGGGGGGGGGGAGPPAPAKDLEGGGGGGGKKPGSGGGGGREVS